MMINKKKNIVFLLCLYINFPLFSQISDINKMFCVNYKNTEIRFNYTLKEIERIFDNNGEYKIDKNVLKINGNYFYFDNEGLYIEKIILNSQDFSVSLAQLFPKKVSLDEIYQIYGGKIKKIKKFSEDNETIIAFIYEVEKKDIKINDNQLIADVNRITFFINYETNICQKIEIQFFEKKKDNLESKLITLGYSESNSMLTAAEKYCIKQEKQNKDFDSFIYKENKIMDGNEVVYIYTFVTIKPQMVNKFVTVYYTDSLGKQHCYEKINNDEEINGCKLLEIKNSVVTTKQKFLNSMEIFLWE